MHRFVLLSLLVALAHGACIASDPGSSGSTTGEKRGNILFVGNSLTYTNNVPALFVAFSREDFSEAGQSVDMVASVISAQAWPRPMRQANNTKPSRMI